LAHTLVSEVQSQRPRRSGSGAMAEGAETVGESQGADVKTQQTTENVLGGPPRQGPLSVLKVSQLLLQAIAAHKGLTLAALKKELRNAGYRVSRNYGHHLHEGSRSRVKGTLLRVSGSDAAGCFRVWKIMKSKRKPGCQSLEEGVRSPRRTPLWTQSPRRRCGRRRAAKKAQEVWRQSLRADMRIRPRAREPVSSRAKEERRAKAVDKGRGRTEKEDIRPRTPDKKRPRSKPRKAKKRAPEKPVKCTIQKPTSVKTDRASNRQGRTHDPRAARTKTSIKSEGPQNAARNP
uniref:Testis-specific H1 histone n=2 Tax=Monodon monoceros TaxID=40151 RepID=A0A8C6CAE6_MONMO